MALGSLLVRAQEAPFTITTNARVVITDVEVTDAHGRPVHGLKESDFGISDNGKPQQIRSFTEQIGATRTASTTTTALPKGVFSNAALASLPPTVNVLLIDPFDTDVPDQMFLRLQLLRALDKLAGQTMAVVAINSGHGAIMLQGFTTDQALLRAAVNRELPRLVPNGGDLIEHLDDTVAAISTLSTYLSGVPGHKNLLWFSSSYPLIEQSFGGDSPNRAANQSVLDHLYNQLSLDRVAVYPIDVNGPETSPSVTAVGQARPHGGENGGANADAGGVDAAGSTAAGGRDITGEVAMDQLANMTGGEAFYDRNDVARGIEEAVEEGSDYYTLSYAPTPFVADNTFHKVAVTVAGGQYVLHYRAGYVAFSSLKAGQGMSQREVALVNEDLDQLASGKKLGGPKEPQNRTGQQSDYTPAEAAQTNILFEARILPASQVPGWQVEPPARDGKGHLIENAKDTPYVIEYAALAHDVDFVPRPGGTEHAELVIAALAYDDSGYTEGTAVSRIGINFSPQQRQLANRIGVPLRQQIRLPHKKLFVALSLIDGADGHAGSVQIPFSPDGQR